MFKGAEFRKSMKLTVNCFILAVSQESAAMCGILIMLMVAYSGRGDCLKILDALRPYGSITFSDWHLLD